MVLLPVKFKIRVIAEEKYVSSLHGYTFVGNSEFRSAEYLPMAVDRESLAAVLEFHFVFIDIHDGQFLTVDVKNISGLKVFGKNTGPSLASVADTHVHGSLNPYYIE